MRQQSRKRGHERRVRLVTAACELDGFKNPNLIGDQQAHSRGQANPKLAEIGNGPVDGETGRRGGPELWPARQSFSSV